MPAMIFLFPDVMVSLPTQTVHTNLPPKVKLKARTLILTLEASCTSTNLMAEHMAWPLMLKII